MMIAQSANVQIISNTSTARISLCRINDVFFYACQINEANKTCGLRNPRFPAVVNDTIYQWLKDGSIDPYFGVDLTQPGQPELFQQWLHTGMMNIHSLYI